MSDAPTTVNVTILDKEYQVACPPDEVDALTASAQYLDTQMIEIRESGKIFGLDRIAVMAALNITNEYLNKQQVETTEHVVGSKVQALSKRVSQALVEQKKPIL
jgi:cell division protein ZapA